jgi:two-component system, cell cycle response regulator
LLQRTRTGHPLSVLICDVDRFKAINDRYGHDVGDIVLRKIGDEVRSLAVPAGRLGDEEFALLGEGNVDDAIDLAEHFREAVSELAIRAGDETIVVTCSVGVAEWEPGDSIDSLLRRANVALYEAKRSGRNRVVAVDSFPLGEQHDHWLGVARLSNRRTK